MKCWRRMEKIKCSKKVSNKQILERLGKNRTLLNNILCRKAKWLGHILRRNFHLHDDIEEQMTEAKRVLRRRRRRRSRTQFVQDLRNRKKY